MLDIYMMYSKCQSQSTYIVIKQGKALIIDAGVELDLIKKACDYLNVQPIATLLTHGHIDHIVYVSQYIEDGLPVYINCDEEYKLHHDDNLSCFLFRNYQQCTTDKLLKSENGHLDLEPFHVDYLFTPGHSKGSLCFLIDNQLFSGDTLFYNNYGVYHFLDGDYDKLKHSLLKVLFALDEDVVFYSGHFNKERLSSKSLIVNTFDNRILYKVEFENTIKAEKTQNPMNYE